MSRPASEYRAMPRLSIRSLMLGVLVAAIYAGGVRYCMQLRPFWPVVVFGLFLISAFVPVVVLDLFLGRRR